MSTNSLGSQVAQRQKHQGIQPLLLSPEALEEEGVSDQEGSPRSDPCPSRGCGDRCLSIRLGCCLAAQNHQGQMEHTAQVGTRGGMFSSAQRASQQYTTSGWHRVQARSAGVRAAPYEGISPLPKPQCCAPPRSTEQCSGCSLLPWQPKGNWRLHPEVVEIIWSRYGRTEVEVFASETSTHCPIRYSLLEGTSPLGQDALAHAWPARLLYTLTPIPLICATLERVQLNHRLPMVAPNWSGQQWFPLLLKLLQGEPWHLHQGDRTFSLSWRDAYCIRNFGSLSALDLAIGSQEPFLASCDQSVIDMVLSSRAPSTRSRYANRWKLFSHWCQTQGEEQENCSVAIILHFLQSLCALLDAGRRCASMLKVYAAAISAGHARVKKQTVGSHYLSVFEGAQKRRHSRVTVVQSEDLTLVFRSVCWPPFEPIGEIEH